MTHQEQQMDSAIKAIEENTAQLLSQTVALTENTRAVREMTDMMRTLAEALANANPNEGS